MGNWRAVGKVWKFAAIGAVSGYASGRGVSDAHGSKKGGEVGAEIGAVTGAALGLPFGRLAKTGVKVTQLVGRGLKATPSSKIGGAMRAAEKASQNVGVTFRRIRGRIVPIRKK